MKSIVRAKSETNPIRYPYLGVSKNIPNRVVLFTEPGEGVILSEAKGNLRVYPIGCTSKLWAEDMFKPLSGSVTLEN